MAQRNVNYRSGLAILTGVFCCTSLPIAALPTSVETTSPTEITQQAMQVDGLVLDAMGEPIIGASVVVKGTTNGVVTDLDGKFQIPNVKKEVPSRFLISAMQHKTLCGMVLLSK